MSLQNPFICYGSDGLSTLCGRPAETARLFSLIKENGNVIVSSPRRIGKTTFFRQTAQGIKEKNDELCIIADIYPARNLKDLAVILANAFLDGATRKGEECRRQFLGFVSEFFELNGPDITRGLTREKLSLGTDAIAEEAVLVLLTFLESFPGRPVLFMDDFQQVLFLDANEFISDMIRRMCNSSKRYVKVFGARSGAVDALLLGENVPYAKMELNAFSSEDYFNYAQRLFLDNGRILPSEVFGLLYDSMFGVTCFIQRTLAAMYDITRPGQTCSEDTVSRAIDRILDENGYIYEDLIRELPPRQTDLLFVIARNHSVTGMASTEFCFANGISASSVQSARRALLEKQLISDDTKETFIRDEFLRLWINRTF